jgi:hypothetical protein
MDKINGALCETPVQLKNPLWVDQLPKAAFQHKHFYVNARLLQGFGLRPNIRTACGIPGCRVNRSHQEYFHQSSLGLRTGSAQEPVKDVLFVEQWNRNSAARFSSA